MEVQIEKRRIRKLLLSRSSHYTSYCLALVAIATLAFLAQYIFAFDATAADTDTPIITSLSPTTGPSTGGTTITISGTGFDKTPSVGTADYIQDGLELHLDAIDNTDSGHDDSALTWKNLAPGVDSSTDCEVLGGATWSSDHISFNGSTSQYVRCGIYRFTNPTWEVVTRASAPQATSSFIMSNVQSGGIQIHTSSNTGGGSTGYVGIASNVGGIYYQLNTDITTASFIDNLSTITTRHTNTQHLLDIVSAQQSNQWSLPRVGNLVYNATTPVVLSGNPDANGNITDSAYNGDIYSARIYNRLLTDDEVRHNQVVDHYRYGVGSITDPRRVILRGASSSSDCLITSITDTSITCTTQANPIGPLDVIFHNGIEEVTILPAAFISGQEVAITSVSPDQGSSAGGTVLTITGTNLNAVAHLRDYIQDGLELHLDAANNLGEGQHSSTTTVWNNLAQNGENCNTIGNVSWSSNTITVDGVNGAYVRCGLHYKIAHPTWEVVAEAPVLPADGLIMSNVHVGGLDIHAQLNSNGLVGFRANIAGAYRTFSSDIASAGLVAGPLSISSRYDGSKMLLDINDSQWSQNQTGNLGYNATTPVVLGGNPNANGVLETEYFHGNIYSARIYNRSLSDPEIRHNKAVDYHIFGIGNDPRTVTLSSANGSSNCAITEVAPDGSYLKCTADATPTGMMDVTFNNGFGGVSTLANSFFSGEHISISSVSPTRGPITGGTELTISGTNLHTVASIGDYVEDGLQLHVDAINNTGSGHDNSATTWKNLVAGRPDCTVNGLGLGSSDAYWSDNSLTVQGSLSQFVSCTNNYKFATPTWEVVVKSHGNPVPTAHIMSDTEYGGIGVHTNNSILTNNMYIGGGYVTYDTGVSDAAFTNKPATITVSYDGTQQFVALNDAKWSIPRTGVLGYNRSTPFVLGGNPIADGTISDSPYNGEFFAARIYDRPLTDAELARNQVVDFYRYGAGVDARIVTLGNGNDSSRCLVTEIASDGSYLKCTTQASVVGTMDMSYDNSIGGTGDIPAAFTFFGPPSTAPTLDKLTPSSDAIELSWTAPVNDDPDPIIGYQIEVSVDDGDNWELVEASTDNLVTTYSYVAPSSDISIIYSFRISAVNAAGAGPSSNILSSDLNFINISLDTANIAIDISPTSTNTVSSRRQTTSFTTSADNGIQLSISTDTNHSDLLSLDGTAIAAVGDGTSTATISNPIALTSNTWGMAIARTGTNITNNFDDSYTIEQDNIISTSRWARVPAKTNPLLIKTTSTANPQLPDTTDIFFAAAADISLPPDTYSTTILYTAVMNP